MIYLINEYYLPNSAEYNRMLSFVKGFNEEKESVKIVYIVAPKDKELLPKDTLFLNNIQHGGGLWGKMKNIYLTNKFICSLHNDDRVVFLTTTWCMIYPLLCRHRKHNCGKIYHEQTEYPTVLRPDNVLNRLLYKLYFKSCLRLDGLFVISEPLKQLFIEKGLSPSKIHIINITVDPTRFSNLEKDYNANYLAYCGTVSNRKDGVSDLIKAFSIVATHFSDIKLYIIGKCDNSKELLDNKKLIEDLGLADSVVLTGMVPYTEMPKLLFNARALLLSRPNNIQAKYGFPTKLGEYLLTGNPVVVTRVGDIPLFLRNGLDALLAAPDDYMDFADCILKVLNNPKESITVGESGKKIAQKYFNYKKETLKMLSVIK